ncbi:MAG: beta-L-arabinofuranosidase domain-containing protein [Bacteroidota bacterium]
MKTNRLFSLAVILLIAASGSVWIGCQSLKSMSGKLNLAVIATPSASIEWGNWAAAMNDGLTPTDTLPWRPRAGRGPRRPPMPQFVQYEWLQPIQTNKVDLFLWDYKNGLELPQAYRISYWDGNEFVPVKRIKGQGLENGRFNTTTFEPVVTTRLRVDVDSAALFTANVVEWKVYPAPGAPDVAPVLSAGNDRVVMDGGKTWLSGSARTVTGLNGTLWEKQSGPGAVTFADATAMKTTATFSQPGNYVLSLTALEGKMKATSTLKVKVQLPPQSERLDVVYTKRYSINSPLWNDRARAIIVNWIPWCIDQINRTDLKTGQGGMDNFIEAAKALQGKPHGKHLGYVFSNAWVHQTVESMSIALMVDPQGDPGIIKAQEKMKATLEDWIPKILAAQEPDGYLQTAYTLRDTTRWKSRWAPETRGNHEGYVAGYFIESAINHYTLTNGKDTRLYDAAKKLADCWVANIGPGRNAWFDGHQEMEQALVRFGRFVNDMEGNHRGDSYIDLAKFLLDNRGGGEEYDQSHVPVQQQYEAVGHAVRAAYTYSGMTDIAAETGDVDYQSATMSLWDNIVNKKYYITGGIGSGESAEGFGPEYSLGNRAYCEACSSCGMIFFHYKMNLAYHDARYVDNYEETMYNALLGSLDLEGKNFYYDNPLVSNEPRYNWHVCPCCVGNIPRTLLMIPTWTYVKGTDGIYVNLFIGSTINVDRVAGTDVEMVQETNYPWSGKVSINVNPKDSKVFTVYVRVPNRTTSDLYMPAPKVSGLKSLAVNGKQVDVGIMNGYAPITRKWAKGDKIDLEIPMEVQRVIADEHIVADRGKVALRYGPLVYNVELADQPDIEQSLGAGQLSTEWRPDLLRGVVTIKGTWANGTPLLAIPNFARNNRDTARLEDRRKVTSAVWINR